MILRGISLLLITGIFFALTTIPASTAAPATFDQRQEGKYNVQANLENFLIIFATSNQNNLLSELAAQALELQTLTSRSKSKAPSRNPQEQQQEAVVYETEETNIGREPYHVEIVHIDKEGVSSPQSSDELEKLDKVEKDDAPKSSSTENLKSAGGSNAPADEQRSESRGRSLWRDVKSELEEMVQRGTDFVQKKPYESEISKDSKEEVPKNAKPGASLKKQLSKKEQENTYLTLREKNDISSNEEIPEELKLLGGGIENCGPRRYRDSSGICQADKSFGSN